MSRRVEQRQQELGIADVGLVELVELADVMADRQAEVPQRLQQRVDEALLRRRERLLEERAADRRRNAERAPAGRSRQARRPTSAAPVCSRAASASCWTMASICAVYRACTSRPAAARRAAATYSARAGASAPRHCCRRGVRARRCGGHLRPVRSHGCHFPDSSRSKLDATATAGILRQILTFPRQAANAEGCAASGQLPPQTFLSEVRRLPRTCHGVYVVHGLTAFM